MTYWERLLAEYVGGGDSPISPTLIAKSITTNGTYNAVDDEADGYSSVSVNVPNTSTLKGNLPLTFKTSEEQLRDWTIYGNNYEHTYSAEGTLPLTFTTHTAGNADDWVIYGNDENGTENLLKITAESQTVNNVQITINADKTVTVNGTASGNIYFNLSTIRFSQGTYTISSGGAGTTSGGTAVIYAYDGSYHICDPNDKTWALSESKDVSFVVWISSGKTVDNLTFKPMFVQGSTAPDHYIPYQQGVGERTENEFDYSQGCDWSSSSNGLSNQKIIAQQGDVFTVTSTSALYALVRGYDANDAQISGSAWSTGGTSTYTAPANIAYVKVVFRNFEYSAVTAEQKATINETMLVKGSTAPTTYIPYGYEVPLTISQQGQPDKTYDIYIGDSPLTEGESVSKQSTGVNLELFEGANTISTTLYNKPSMSIIGLDYVGVGEPTNDGWQIPLTVSDGTNTTTVNVPIDAPLTSTDSVSGVVDIPTYVGTNTIDTTLVEPVTADIVYVGANSALINKTINQNGTYFAYSDNANGYNSVAVAVPNTYTNEDESKVVSNGELVAQTTASVTTNGIVDTTTIRSISVDVPTAGSTTGDVRFLDYDGTVVQAYSKSDFASLTALPANPAHEGLTAQGWNWSLEDAKTYVAAYDKLDIGQMYITNDGKTRLYITLDDGRLNPTLAIAVNGSCDVDWGDGTTHDTLTGTSLSSRVATSHTYATGGDYVIALTVTGSFAFVGGTSGGLLFTYNNAANNSRSTGYRNILRAVELGDGVTSIDSYAFYNYYALSNITIPNSVTSIADHAFLGSRLFSITIPNSVTSIAEYTFSVCYALSSVAIPNSITSIGRDAFDECDSLSSVTIPSSVTGINYGAFSLCHSLSSITIPNSVTGIGSNAFYNCLALSSITISSSVTNIADYTFYGCSALSSITIPNSVTGIGSNAFYNCQSLSSITIPSDVARIGSEAFYQCYSLGYIKFMSVTPPIVANSNAFSSVPTDCTIYVPTGTLADYTSAQYYPSSSTYTYVEY